MTENPGYTIRAAMDADLSKAQALMRRTVEEDFGTPYNATHQRDIDDLASAYLEPSRHTLLVAVDDGTGDVIGTGGIRVGRLHGGPEHLVRRYAGDDIAQLVRIYVRREDRRRGIARALVRECLAFALADGGYNLVALHTYPHSPGALPFWESLATQVGYQDGTEVPPEVFFEIDLDAARRLVAGERTVA